MAGDRAFHAGVAVRDITPPVGLELGGGPFGRATGILHPLKARALVLALGEARAMVLSADLLGFEGGYARSVRDAIARRTGLDRDAILLAGTHTHGAPATVPLRNWGRPDEAYLASLRDRLIEAAAGAVDRLTPARLGAGTGRAPGLAINRSLGESGPVDDFLGAVRIDAADGRPIAVVVNFACHPVNLHSAGLVTPDYPHYLERGVQAGLGAEVPVLFLLGPCGDLNPVNFHRRPDEGAAEATGGRVAQAALEVLGRIETGLPASLGYATREVEVPLQPLPPREEILEVARERAAKIAAIADPGPTNDAWCGHQSTLEWTRDALEALDAGSQKASVRLPLAALAVGEVGVVGLPGELFTEFGPAIRGSSPFAVTLVATLVGGCYGYFPARWSYERRSYESTACPRFLGLQAFDPSVGERLRDAAGAVLGSVHA